MLRVLGSIQRITPSNQRKQRWTTVDHQIFGVHYVRQVPDYTVYNLTFLAIAGIGFIVISWLLLRAGRSDLRV